MGFGSVLITAQAPGGPEGGWDAQGATGRGAPENRQGGEGAGLERKKKKKKKKKKCA